MRGVLVVCCTTWGPGEGAFCQAVVALPSSKAYSEDWPELLLRSKKLVAKLGAYRFSGACTCSGACGALVPTPTRACPFCCARVRASTLPLLMPGPALPPLPEELFR